MSVSFVSLQSTRVHLQSNIFIFRKGVETHCDMAKKKILRNRHFVGSSLFTLCDPALLMKIRYDDTTLCTANTKTEAILQKDVNMHISSATKREAKQNKEMN